MSLLIFTLLLLKIMKNEKLNLDLYRHVLIFLGQIVEDAPDCFKFWAKIWCERKPIKSLSTHAQNIWIVTLDKILMSWCEWHFLSDFFLQELKFQNTHPSDTTVIRTYFAMGNNLFLLQICRYIWDNMAQFSTLGKVHDQMMHASLIKDCLFSSGSWNEFKLSFLDLF